MNEASNVATGGYSESLTIAPGEVVISRTVENTREVLRTLFRAAQRRVRILSTNLDPTLFDLSVGEAASGFLMEHVSAKITILLENRINTDSHPFFNVPRLDGVLARIGLFLVPSDAQKTYSFNFTVVDGRHFRFEPDRAAASSLVQYDSPQNATDLDKLFCRLKSIGTPELVE